MLSLLNLPLKNSDLIVRSLNKLDQLVVTGDQKCLTFSQQYVKGEFYLKKSDVAYLIDTLLTQQREEIINQLKNTETSKWKDAQHCTCLQFAIHKLEYPYEDE